MSHQDDGDWIVTALEAAQAEIARLKGEVEKLTQRNTDLYRRLRTVVRASTARIASETRTIIRIADTESKLSQAEASLMKARHALDDARRTISVGHPVRLHIESVIAELDQLLAPPEQETT